jgi:hypothetical protein
MSSQFMIDLEKAAYFAGLPPDKAAVLKAYFVKHGWHGIFGDSHRYFFADAESLAEGGIGQFIHELEPFLSTQGVTLPKIEDEMTEGGYIVHVGGIPFKIYDASEMNDSSRPGHFWALSMTRGFRIVNDLLAKADSSERIYAINGGNDLFAIFLTPEMFRIVSSYPDASVEGGPYQPTEDFPLYGESQT